MLKPGDTVERYTLESVLGEGGMGRVFRAHDERLDRHVALKVVRVEKTDDGAPASDAMARLMREARAAAKLAHPNAVSIFDVGEVGGTAFIAMELVAGKTLRAFIGDKRVPYTERLRFLVDAARALSAAHGAGLVHRDVKPENVMVRTDGMVKVLDFGIARRSAAKVDPSAPTEQGTLLTLTAAGAAVGTPLYMAPEQIRGTAVDGRTDQFAWGVLAYELLTGNLPWTSKNEALALAAAILTERPRPIADACPEVLPEVEDIITKALAKDPADRFATMDELLLALEPLALPSSVSVPPSPLRAERPSRAAPASVDFRRYSAETVRAIIGGALERQDQVFASEDLIEAAREIGVDEPTLRAAASELALRRAEMAEHVADRRRDRVKLFRHAGIWAVVNLFMYFMVGWGFTRWMLFGWGIAVAIQAVKCVFPEDLKEKRERLAKKGRKRTKGQPPPPLLDEEEVRKGVEALLSTTSARVKRRIAVPRMRVGETSDREAEKAAEAEQEQLEPRRPLARR